MPTAADRQKVIAKKIEECNIKLIKLEQKKNRMIRGQQRLENDVNTYKRKQRTHFLIVVGATVVKNIGKVEVSEDDVKIIAEFLSNARTADGKNLQEYLADKKEKSLS